MDYFCPKYYVLGIDSFENKPDLKARVKKIIEKCEAHGAIQKTPEEAKQELKGLSAVERYDLGKQTLQIEELKRSSVHFFNNPKGAIESPQLIINHGMICPHSCQYCYWQKDLFTRSRITIYANPKERFEADLKIAMAIWRVFSAFLRFPSCKDAVDDKLFVWFDERIRKQAKNLDSGGLNNICFDLAEKTLEKWKVPPSDRKSIKALIKDGKYAPKVVFNSGENNDSIALEHITDVQQDILIPIVLSTDSAYLMLRTKSIHYDFLEQFKDHEKKDRIIISPSLMQQEFIEKYEPGNYSLKKRLKALEKLAGWGFKIFPCFSPLIYERGYGEETVKQFVKTLKEYLPPERIVYYTLGSLRLGKMAHRNIRMIRPNTALDSPYFVHPKHSSGDKFRYPKIIRTKMYASFIREMNANGYDKVPRYVQTETVEGWKALTTDKYKDLGLDLDKCQSGELDLEALTQHNPPAEAEKAKEAPEKPTWTMNDFYLYVSALQKAIRWCEVNDARYFAQRLTQMEKPGANFNRLLIIAAEDVGLADPLLIAYVREYLEAFESLLKRDNIKRRDVVNYPNLCGVIDRAVIAAAISYKSRLLPQLSFATLYGIYKKETFTHNISEYSKRFLRAVQGQDEGKALYYAYILAIFLNSKDLVLSMIRKESKLRNEELIDEWIKEYKRSHEILFLAGSVLLLCRTLVYSYGEYQQLISHHLSSPITVAKIPDRAYDMHTRRGGKMGRGLKHFFREAATVRNERFPNNWDAAGTKAYLDAEQKGIAKTSKVIQRIKTTFGKNNQSKPEARAFIINLPFKYKRAVLTQARTSKNKEFAFVVELPKGNRKFMKGPFEDVQRAQDHVIFNEVKQKLASKYLHPIQCEVKKYGDSVFLECEELGRADLNKVTKKPPTKLDNRWFDVLDYSTSDAVPNPFSFLNKITKENENIWVEVIVNYCFRWIFKIGDAAARNLMLEKSTGKIYSTDEIRLKRKDVHPTIWNGRHAPKGALSLVKGFASSPLLERVLDEVERWRDSLDVIRSEVFPISKGVEARIDRLLGHPGIVLGI